MEHEHCPKCGKAIVIPDDDEMDEFERCPFCGYDGNEDIVFDYMLEE